MLPSIMLAVVAACLVSAASLPRATCGCGKSYRPGYTDSTKHTIISGTNTTNGQPIKRSYGVNVPETYNDDPHRAWPLILDYHGNGGNSTQQYNNSQYFKYAKGQEYLVVYPNSFNGSWQSANYSIDHTTEGAVDLDFTTDLVQHIREEYCIDDNRIYASGKSNGGGFVDLLACSDHGDEFSAFAMAAPALYSDLKKSDCSKKRAIIQSHGDQDATIPYHPNGEPGAGGPLPDIDEWVSWWGQRTCGSKAKPNPPPSRQPSGYNTTTYSCEEYDDIIHHYQIFELGHCWPSSTSDNWDVFGYSARTQETRKCLDRSLDFTPEVLKFFEKWNKKTAPKN